MIQKKGQSAIEFFMLIGALMFFFLVFFIAINFKIGETRNENINIAMNEIAKGVQDEIALATEFSDEYFRYFDVPLKVEGINYDINITDGFVHVRTYNGLHALALPVQNVTGNVVKGQNFIRKTGGRVFLN